VDIEKTDRMAVIFGIGHTFGSKGISLTTEVSCHVTMASKDLALDYQIPTNFFRLSLGFVF